MRAESPPPSHREAIGLLLLTSVLWSSGGVLIKGVEWHPGAIASVRGAIAAVTIFACLRGRVRLTWSRWQLVAAVAYAATTLLFVLANKLTTAANAILLQYGAPIYVSLLAPRLLGERVRAADWIALVITFGGITLFFFDELSGAGLAGNLVAVVSGVTLAIMTIALRKQQDGSPVESILLGNVIAVVVGLPFVQAPWPGADGWVWLLVLGVVQLGISYVPYARAARRASAMELALIPMLEPILNPIWVWLVFAEQPGRFALWGGLLVLGGVVFRATAAWRDRTSLRPQLVS